MHYAISHKTAPIVLAGMCKEWHDGFRLDFLQIYGLLPQKKKEGNEKNVTGQENEKVYKDKENTLLKETKNYIVFIPVKKPSKQMNRARWLDACMLIRSLVPRPRISNYSLSILGSGNS